MLKQLLPCVTVMLSKTSTVHAYLACRFVRGISDIEEDSLSHGKGMDWVKVKKKRVDLR